MSGRRNSNNTDTHRQCADCGRVLPRSEFHIARAKHDGIFNYCKDCSSARCAAIYERRKKHIADRRKEIKQKYIFESGGCCSRCGYHEFISGLDFHHTSGARSKDKEANVADLITKEAQSPGIYTDRLLDEIRKCVILCRNCHCALHAGEW